MTLWVVRSGKYGEREALALDNGLAVIGWDELPDLAKLKSREDLRASLEDAYAGSPAKTLSNWESQLWPFAHVMETGDLVVMPLKSRSAIVIGRVSGPYNLRKDLGQARHTRPVEWIKEVPRSAFAQDLLYSFGSFMTVCRVARNSAEQRVLAVLAGKADPMLSGSLAEVPQGQKSLASGQNIVMPEEATASVDLAQVADDAIRLRIGTAFKGHKLSTLVGAILETHGYRVVVSPPGADGGVDIVAGKGALGFDDPRLVVQVKSQDSPVDVTVLRELQGVMRQYGAEQGLLVAWGGVTRALEKEARRLFFEIRIWDAGDIVHAVQFAYGSLSDAIQAELPMKRIWILAEQE
ncbi:MAG: restriction endonuclease [Burkholderiales bacterium]|nr:restriction endonuclease [Burkholderiales bacterium]